MLIIETAIHREEDFDGFIFHGTMINESYNGAMDKAISEILCALQESDLSPQELDRLIRKHSRRLGDGRRRMAKKHILASFLEAKAEGGGRWDAWNISPELEKRFIGTLRMKPRRTASGVATITVITKPWPCGGGCIFCPNDVRMPKSYLHSEPACQRAERNRFDPYLQVASRLEALHAMGHDTDKVELIILGGTWTDYPLAYRLWFIGELFACLNATDAQRQDVCNERRRRYEEMGIPAEDPSLESWTSSVQSQVNQGELTYNDAYEILYGRSPGWREAAVFQEATLQRVESLQKENETAAHRVVGLVIETRPDAITVESLTEARQMGCTKIQMGIQSLDERILSDNGRPMDLDTLERAFSLLRLFGFKSHIHFMINLLGATPGDDIEGYRQLMEDERFRPDEVKLYPCALVAGTPLVGHFQNDSWRPYDEEELLSVLGEAMVLTPPYTRISRMIRDIGADDIIAGNKKANLRQMVDRSLEGREKDIQEIRFREVGVDGASLDELRIVEETYGTLDSTEHFLQWVTPKNRIVGFLRLSLPHRDAFLEGGNLPIQRNRAMIREVHIYGFAARIAEEGQAAQHHGLGRKLIEHACDLASEEGYDTINVISAVGTRDYYRALGFQDGALYQWKPL